MKSLLKNSSLTFEFILVVTVAFGLFAWSSYDSLVGRQRKVVMTDGSLLSIIITEVVLGGLLLSYLKLRGWKWADFNLHLSWKSTIDGVLLLLATYLAVTFSVTFTSLFVDIKILQTVQLHARVGVFISIVLSIVNALYEEVFVSVYVINTLEKHHDALLAVLCSATMRMAYHVYQGPPAVIMILPIGLLYGYAYWRWKRLWPLVVAHALVDIISLNFQP